MKNNLLKIVCGGMLLSLIGANPAHALSFGANIITNGGAEKGLGAADAVEVTALPQWKRKGKLTAVQYNAPGFLTATSPDPRNRGKNFFAGGPDNRLSKAIKTIDLSSVTSAIDGNGVSYVLSGYFGGYSSQNDHAVLSAVFFDASNQRLNQVSIGNVLATDRADTTSLLLRKLNGIIPAGTRSVELTLTMSRTDGSYNDGYADSLSLVLTEIVPPSTASLQSSDH